MLSLHLDRCMHSFLIWNNYSFLAGFVILIDLFSQVCQPLAYVLLAQVLMVIIVLDLLLRLGEICHLRGKHLVEVLDSFAFLCNDALVLLVDP